MNNMTKYTVLSAFIFLFSCGGDDDASTNSDAGSKEPAQSSFTSRPSDNQLLTLIKQSGRYDIDTLTSQPLDEICQRSAQNIKTLS